MFNCHDTVKLPDTDAAGILFFGNYIKLAHIIYEDFMETIGFSLKYIIDEADYLILIAHTEADYKKSLRLGDGYDLSVQVEKIGNCSFTLKYYFTEVNDDAVAELQTVHVVVDKSSQRPSPLPKKLVEQLKKYQ